MEEKLQICSPALLCCDTLGHIQRALNRQIGEKISELLWWGEKIVLIGMTLTHMTRAFCLLSQ